MEIIIEVTSSDGEVFQAGYEGVVSIVQASLLDAVDVHYIDGNTTHLFNVRIIKKLKIQ